jgi:hypothetical protein
MKGVCSKIALAGSARLPSLSRGSEKILSSFIFADSLFFVFKLFFPLRFSTLNFLPHTHAHTNWCVVSGLKLESKLYFKWFNKILLVLKEMT